MIKRRPDWRARLHAEIEAHRREPFAFGQRDCLLMAAAALKAMTGVDIAIGLRGAYTTLKGGKRVLRRAGYDDLPALFGEHLEEVPSAFARHGDLVTLRDGGGWAAGIVAGARVTVMRPEGLGSVDRDEIDRAFRVP